MPRTCMKEGNELQPSRRGFRKKISNYLDVPWRKLGSKVIGSLGYFTPIRPPFRRKWNNPLILTSVPGHPSMIFESDSAITVIRSNRHATSTSWLLLVVSMFFGGGFFVSKTWKKRKNSRNLTWQKNACHMLLTNFAWRKKLHSFFVRVKILSCVTHLILNWFKVIFDGFYHGRPTIEPAFGRICLELFSSIKQANPSLFIRKVHHLFRGIWDHECTPEKITAGTWKSISGKEDL